MVGGCHSITWIKMNDRATVISFAYLITSFIKVKTNKYGLGPVYQAYFTEIFYLKN
jgi:hypothetical protein